MGALDLNFKSDKVTHPTKEAVRNWLIQRTNQRSELPSPEEIRRQLGWYLIQENGNGAR